MLSEPCESSRTEEVEAKFLPIGEGRLRKARQDSENELCGTAW